MSNDQHKMELSVLQNDMDYMKRDIGEVKADLKQLSIQFTAMNLEWKELSSTLRRAMSNSDWIEQNRKSIEEAIRLTKQNDRWINKHSGIIVGILGVINLLLLIAR
jgi:regulator of replication initiation timing